MEKDMRILEWNERRGIYYSLKKMEASEIFIVPADYVVVKPTTFHSLTAPKFY